MSIELTVPEVGESIQEVQILEWKKHQGDWVEKDEDVVEIETEKATVAIPSPSAGRLVQIVKADGDYAEVGDVIALLEKDHEGQPAEGAEGGSQPQAAKPQEPEPEEPQPEKRQSAQPHAAQAREQEASTAEKQAAAQPADEGEKQKRAAERRRAAPAAAEKEAAQPQPKAEEAIQREEEEGTEREHEPYVEPKRHAEPRASTATVETKPMPQATATTETRRPAAKTGNGRGPRAQPTPPRTPLPVSDAERREQAVPMSIIRRTIARRLVEAQQNAALLTTFNEIDMQEAIDLRRELREEFRQHYDVKLGFMSLFVKAVVESLKHFPELNAQVRGNEIVYHSYADIGIAIGSDRGLVVPVLRDCQRLGFAEIERQIDDFAARAAAGRLAPDELEGGTFTITNGGTYGSLLSTPIVNPPQSGVLGMHAIQERPVARDGSVVIRPMMYVALTYDHRVVDGREAVGFLRHVKEIVELPERLLLEL